MINVILVCILVTISFPLKKASINPSSPSAAREYSHSSAAFMVSPFVLFSTPVQSVLHFSSIEIWLESLWIRVSTSISSLLKLSSSGTVSSRACASSMVRCTWDFAGPISFHRGPDISNSYQRPYLQRHFVTKDKMKVHCSYTDIFMLGQN